eukprot:PITA_22521
MHSLISIVRVVLTGKENHLEWSQKIKHTLIFNELWKGVCVGDRDKEPEQPTSNKEFAIWENKNNKAYVLIATSVNEEVSHHISPFSNAFKALQRLKELYDSHSTLEVVQLMIKLFSLELQNDDPLALASEVKSIMHDIKVTNVELDIPMIAFLKVLYPTYSNYLESFQENGNLKDITFDSLVKRIAEREKAFGKKTTPQSSEEVVCLAYREKNITQDSSRGRVYFVDKSKLKPSGLGTIRLELLGLTNFLLHHVLYLPQLRRNLLSLVHICQQGHSIHMFDGKIEVRKASDHSLAMTGIEEERLLKLQGTSARAQNFSYNSHYEEGTFPSSLLWNARFGHLNYENLCLLKKNGVTSLPTIPRKLKQCDACILGKYSK